MLLYWAHQASKTFRKLRLASAEQKHHEFFLSFKAKTRERVEKHSLSDCRLPFGPHPPP
jgi:hypothetical protein